MPKYGSADRLQLSAVQAEHISATQKENQVLFIVRLDQRWPIHREKKKKKVYKPEVFS